LPSIETVKSNEYSPLSRPLFIYVNEKAAERNEVQDFLRFYIRTIAELAKEVGFIAMEKSKYDDESKKLEDFINSISKPKE